MKIEFSTEELIKVTSYIKPLFNTYVNKYNSNKYPQRIYNDAIVAFSMKNKNNYQIENALKWKWGHWGKLNYPKNHKKLVNDVIDLWPQYVVNNKKYKPEETFLFWSKNLQKKTRFITIAFISHLLHPEEIPIIDQHNYRSLNYFIKFLRSNYHPKKKPSNWEDIVLLKSFLNSIKNDLNKDIQSIDKFLMMFGKGLKKI